jgi:integrase/recombinase XerD
MLNNEKKISNETGKLGNNSVILTREEIKKIIESEKNPKHRLMIILTYAAGLRPEEMLSMKPYDIDFKNKNIHIKDSKSNKERIIPLSRKILDLIKPYIDIYRPSVWLFPGNDSVSKISEESFKNIFKESLIKAGITREANIHSLRNSFVSHLKDNGSLSKVIQDMLDFNRAGENISIERGHYRKGG